MLDEVFLFKLYKLLLCSSVWEFWLLCAFRKCKGMCSALVKTVKVSPAYSRTELLLYFSHCLFWNAVDWWSCLYCSSDSINLLHFSCTVLGQVSLICFSKCLQKISSMQQLLFELLKGSIGKCCLSGGRRLQQCDNIEKIPSWEEILV